MSYQHLALEERYQIYAYRNGRKKCEKKMDLFKPTPSAAPGGGSRCADR
jgi:hypothetical protein